MEIYYRLILALAVAIFISYLGAKYDEPYSLRVLVMICIGATLLGIVSTEFFKYASFPWTSDPGRLSAQVISALGFMLAGSIWIAENNHIKGISGASSLWLVAILGLLIGTGLDRILTWALFFLIIIYFLTYKWNKEKKTYN